MEQGQQTFGSQPESTASSAVEALQREASDLGREAKRASSELLEKRVDSVFSLLDDVECAVRAAARELENEQHPRLAHYVNRAADEVASARNRFGSPDLNDMIASAEHLARTRPMATLGIAFAAGFAFVRLLKSSAPQTGERLQSRGFEDDEDEARLETGMRARSAMSRGSRGQGRAGGSYDRESQRERGMSESSRTYGTAPRSGYEQRRKDDPVEGRDDE